MPETLKRSARLGLALACLGAVLTLVLVLVAPASGPRAEEKPYNITADGTVDWTTYSGFRRYHAECHVCHGPDGLGSSFAPALIDSLKVIDQDEFNEVVVNGRTVVGSGKENVMPGFGVNLNVMCFLDDIYAYLKARSDGALGRGRPAKRAPKPPEATEHEDDCLG